MEGFYFKDVKGIVGWRKNESVGRREYIIFYLEVYFEGHPGMVNWLKKLMVVVTSICVMRSDYMTVFGLRDLKSQRIRN